MGNSVTLNNEIEMPAIGFGTYTFTPEEAYTYVKDALMIGYRLIDTANIYGNERAVGRAIKDSLIPRDEIFVSSKLWVSEYDNPNAIDETLERLGLDYIDLLFLHQPVGNYMNAYQMIEKAYNEGKVKAIGLSNFEGDVLNEMLNNCKIMPQVVQGEAHPYFSNSDVRRDVYLKDIVFMSWFPLGHGDPNLLNEPILKVMSDSYGKSPAQIILKWHHTLGMVAIPSSRNIEHIREDFELDDFYLSDADMMKIYQLSNHQRYYEPSEDLLNQYLLYKPEYEDG